MRKIMCNQTLYILHKDVKPSHIHDVIENGDFDLHSKEDYFVV